MGLRAALAAHGRELELMAVDAEIDDLADLVAGHLADVDVEPLSGAGGGRGGEEHSEHRRGREQRCEYLPHH